MSQQSRRSIVKGAAWAAPAVLATATIPAYAASKPLLEGVLSVGIRCSVQVTHTVDGQVGNYPQYGLWVSNASSSATIGATKITQYLSNAAGQPVFRRGGTSNQWSDLVYDPDAPVKTGYRAYTTTFRGTWQYDATNKKWFPSSRPYFTTNLNTCVNPLRIIAVRSVTVNGTVYSFERSVTLRPA